MKRTIKLLYLFFCGLIFGLYAYGLLFASLDTYEYYFNVISLLGWGVFGYIGYLFINDLDQ